MIEIKAGVVHQKISNDIGRERLTSIGNIVEEENLVHTICLETVRQSAPEFIVFAFLKSRMPKNVGEVKTTLMLKWVVVVSDLLATKSITVQWITLVQAHSMTRPKMTSAMTKQRFRIK